MVRPGKSCGCLIASNVISLEVSKRKHHRKLKSIHGKLERSPDASLKKKARDLRKAIRDIDRSKSHMKKKFAEYVKKSGYVAPKKNRRV